MELLRKVLKIIIVLIIGLMVIISWMNFTPGYFQDIRCDCGYMAYVTDEDYNFLSLKCEGIIYRCPVPSFEKKFRSAVLRNLARIDFNRNLKSPIIGRMGRKLGKNVIHLETPSDINRIIWESDKVIISLSYNDVISFVKSNSSKMYDYSNTLNFFENEKSKSNIVRLPNNRPFEYTYASQALLFLLNKGNVSIYNKISKQDETSVIIETYDLQYIGGTNYNLIDGTTFVSKDDWIE